MKSNIRLKEQNLAQKIIFVRGEKVLLDFDLAILYQVETRILKQAVKRNKKRFPKDFLFVLSSKEINHLVSQHVIPSKSYLGGSRPFVFTEQGLAMLSGILNSNRAIEVNIAIMRTFVFLRKWIESHKKLAKKIDLLEKKYDGNFAVIFRAIEELIQRKNEPRKQIGFKIKKNG